MKCYICDTEMKKQNKEINTTWGNDNPIINKITCLVCPKCDENLISAKDVLELQKLAKEANT